MHSHSFQDIPRAETLQVGRGRPETGRGGVKIVGGAPAGGGGGLVIETGRRGVKIVGVLLGGGGGGLLL